MKSTKGMKITTVWKLCLEMWDWIAEKMRAGDEPDVEILKYIWAENHEYDIDLACFFCDYAIRRTPNPDNQPLEVLINNCTLCPGRQVEKNFDCRARKHHWREEPLKFHAKLHRMNKKRLQVLRGK